MSLLQEKWRLFLKRLWLFSLIPFVEFVFAAGSLVTGNIQENSDFDVIIGVKKGRIFTARFFCYSFFNFLGWRKKRGDKEEMAKNKFCFSHFVAPDAYKLSPPHGAYWNKLYSLLVPVYGNNLEINKFLKANHEWMDKNNINFGKTGHINNKTSLIKAALERIFRGKLGQRLENKLKKLQIKRIENSLKSENLYNPRIIFNDNELEFHPNTKRIEDYNQKAMTKT